MKIDTAVRYFGNKRKLADALGISRAAIARWKGDEVPELRAYQIAEIMLRDENKALMALGVG